jgi:uncharacterized SAM-binding protein YcdF (DUF218 family)
MLWIILGAVFICVCVLGWGSRLLIANEATAGHVDAAVVLQGSIAAEKVRIAGAIDLLQRNVTDRVLLSIPKESYWGQSVPPVARAYLERTYGNDMAARFDFCETSGDVNSTAQEARALGLCIAEHHYRSIEIVTSNYHTRRAGIVWRKMRGNAPPIDVWIEGVPDPEFQQPWWRHRQSAKTFFMEATKLVWTQLGGG